MYQSSPSKDFVRREWDSRILRFWRDAKYPAGLTYFGLPGPAIRDLIDWREFLAAQRTGVEFQGKSRKAQRESAVTQRRLLGNVFDNGLDSQFQLLRGDVEDVILNGTDVSGTPPQCNDNAARGHAFARFTYGLCNLDFCGGIGYANAKSAPKRIDAIKKLIERQAGTDFLLLLTVNVRDSIGDALANYLDGLASRAYGDEWSARVSWYRSRGAGEREHVLKAVVSSFVHSTAEAHGFRCVCHPPIAYTGHEDARMVHFAFELTNVPGALRAFSEQDERSLVFQPLLQVSAQKLALARGDVVADAPAFRKSLRFLTGVEHSEIFAESMLSVVTTS